MSARDPVDVLPRGAEWLERLVLADSLGPPVALKWRRAQLEALRRARLEATRREATHESRGDG